MSSSSPRSCSMRWKSRGRPLRRFLQSPAPPAGPRTPWSSAAPDGWSGRVHRMWGRSRRR